MDDQIFTHFTWPFDIHLFSTIDDHYFGHVVHLFDELITLLLEMLLGTRKSVI